MTSVPRRGRPQGLGIAKVSRADSRLGLCGLTQLLREGVLRGSGELWSRLQTAGVSDKTGRAGGESYCWGRHKTVAQLQQTQDDRELFRGLSCSCQESRASSKRAVKTSLLGIMLEAKPEGSGLSYHFYPQL